MEKCRLRLEWVPGAYKSPDAPERKDEGAKPLPVPSNGLYGWRPQKNKHRYGFKPR